MSEPTNQELKDLLLGLDKKIDVQFTELKGEVKRIDEKLNGIEKRLGNEEFISRSAFTALIVSVMAGLAKYLFFPTAPGL